MKKILILLIWIVAMAIPQTTKAQEKRTYRDVAFAYLMQNIESITARPWRVRSDSYYKMPNGSYIVDMTISRTLTRQEDAWVNNQVQAYGSTFNVGVKRGYKYTDYDDTRGFIIFVDRNGTPLTYFKAYPNYIIENLDNAVCFIIVGSTMDVDGEKIKTEDK